MVVELMGFRHWESTPETSDLYRDCVSLSSQFWRVQSRISQACGVTAQYDQGLGQSKTSDGIATKQEKKSEMFGMPRSLSRGTSYQLLVEAMLGTGLWVPAVEGSPTHHHINARTFTDSVRFRGSAGE